MTQFSNRQFVSAVLIMSGLLSLSTASFADRGYGMGMMHNEDHEHMMSRGYGGMGMMGSGMGMMGQGMGMMGGMGYGHEMMGIMQLNLDDTQRSKIRQLLRDMRKQHLKMMEQHMEESDKLYDLYDADNRDPKAIGKVYAKLFDMQRQMIEDSIVTTNKALELLTPEQRTQLKSWRAAMPGPGMMGGRMMMPMMGGGMMQ